jgi:hypothetical protein
MNETGRHNAKLHFARQPPYSAFQGMTLRSIS